MNRAGKRRGAAAGSSSSAGRTPTPSNPARGARSLVSAAAHRLLAALKEPGTSARSDPTRDGIVIIQGRRAGISLGRGQHARAALDELRDHDLVEEGPARGHAGISKPGRAYLRRLAAKAHEEPFEAQHRSVVTRDVPATNGPERVTINLHESPLEWLSRRRGRDGEPLIDAAGYEAGERLRRDLTFAGMLPSVTARWEGAIGGGAAGLRDPASAADAVIAARQRVRAALTAVGRDFADLLTDLCGFLKGLEAIERERGWPPRSGKVVVRMALRQLAGHYGLEIEATGSASSRGVTSWQAPADGPS